MYQESVQKPKLTLPKFVGLLIILTGITMVLMLLSSLLIRWTGIGWFDALPLLILAGLIFYVYRRQCLSYRYTITDDMLIAEQMTGNAPRLQFRIALSAIQEISIASIPVQPLRSEERLYHKDMKRPIYRLRYTDDAGHSKSLLFQPSEQMVDRLNGNRSQIP